MFTTSGPETWKQGKKGGTVIHVNKVKSLHSELSNISLMPSQEVQFSMALHILSVTTLSATKAAQAKGKQTHKRDRWEVQGVSLQEICWKTGHAHYQVFLTLDSKISPKRESCLHWLAATVQT